MTDEANNTDHLFITAHVSGWDIFKSEADIFSSELLEIGKMNSNKEF